MFKNLLKMFKPVKEHPYVTQFEAIVNGDMRLFNSRKEMFSFIEEYSKLNTIYSLSMFKVQLFEIEKS